MNVAVLGTWHLGSVTAACLAAAGHQVHGWDPDERIVSELAAGRPPISEPGLAELVREQLDSARLRFTADLSQAVRDADVVWITFDTPVDEDDRADTEFVERQVQRAFPFVKDGVLFLSSSQLPVGTIARLEQAFTAQAGAIPVTKRASFACSPENLRLGKSIEVFTHPDRVIVGTRHESDRARIATLFEPITDRLEFMSVESAEMTKHAINAFLATSVTFINELATLCEQAGADARDVERGLKTESRIGPKAYLGPGAAFAGGTLARDVVFLRQLGERVHRSTPLMDGVESSNREHRGWARRRLQHELGALAGKTIAVWGLTYKPGTDTLRRSTSVELCRWLTEQGARVQVHDPAVAELPAELSGVVRAATPLDAAWSADALVVATEWPAYRAVDSETLAAAMPTGIVLDANRFLGATLGADRRFRLISVGRA
jgi:UDPglucose 6-dehydrogenase